MIEVRISLDHVEASRVAVYDTLLAVGYQEAPSDDSFGFLFERTSENVPGLTELFAPQLISDLADLGITLKELPD